MHLACRMVAVGVFAAVFVAFVVFSRLRYFRYLIWVAHDRPTALKKGCGVCGGPAVHATWHVRTPRSLWPFGPSRTVAWCQTHYDEARARMRSTPPSAVK
jgi:hypothetical protein